MKQRRTTARCMHLHPSKEERPARIHNQRRGVELAERYLKVPACDCTGACS